MSSSILDECKTLNEARSVLDKVLFNWVSRELLRYEGNIFLTATMLDASRMSIYNILKRKGQGRYVSGRPPKPPKCSESEFQWIEDRDTYHNTRLVIEGGVRSNNDRTSNWVRRVFPQRVVASTSPLIFMADLEETEEQDFRFKIYGTGTWIDTKDKIKGRSLSTLELHLNSLLPEIPEELLRAN